MNSNVYDGIALKYWLRRHDLNQLAILHKGDDIWAIYFPDIDATVTGSVVMQMLRRGRSLGSKVVAYAVDSDMVPMGVNF